MGHLIYLKWLLFAVKFKIAYWNAMFVCVWGYHHAPADAATIISWKVAHHWCALVWRNSHAAAACLLKVCKEMQLTLLTEQGDREKHAMNDVIMWIVSRSSMWSNWINLCSHSHSTRMAPFLGLNWGQKNTWWGFFLSRSLLTSFCFYHDRKCFIRGRLIRNEITQVTFITGWWHFAIRWECIHIEISFHVDRVICVHPQICDGCLIRPFLQTNQFTQVRRRLVTTAATFFFIGQVYVLLQMNPLWFTPLNCYGERIQLLTTANFSLPLTDLHSRRWRKQWINESMIALVSLVLSTFTWGVCFVSVGLLLTSQYLTLNAGGSCECKYFHVNLTAR